MAPSVTAALLAAALLATAASAAFNILDGPAGCEQAASGISYIQIGFYAYPSSPWKLTPFQRLFTNPETLAAPPQVQHASEPYTADYHDLNVTEELVDWGIPQCKGKKTPMLLYNKVFPGPLIQARIGVQTLIRVSNLIPVNSTNYPAHEKSWGPGYTPKNLCKERARRTGFAGEASGRAISTHHHGMASLAPFDGGSEDVICAGEWKYYALPHNLASTFFYHDHTLGTTSENTYAGLVGMHIVHPCKLPYGLAGMPVHTLQLNDIVFDAQCRLLNDRVTAHHDAIYGDINLVNGVPWPVMTARPSWTRFKALNASPARIYYLMFKTESGKSVGHEICWIVGSDAGFFDPPTRFPVDGLLLGSAYRWEFVCDFTQLTGQTLYLVNSPRPVEVPEPFFCYSHLLMKINIREGLPGEAYSKPINLAPLVPDATFDPTDLVGPFSTSEHKIGKTQLALAKAKLAQGKVDRKVEFSFIVSPIDWMALWVIDGKGWDTGVTPAEDNLIYNNIGQNTVEVWNLTVRGGVHPVHMHLIDFVVLSVDGKPPPPELVHASKDTIHINAESFVIVAARYGPSVGKYSFHCHQTIHEDRDMMRAFLVRDAVTGLTSMTKLTGYGLLRRQGRDCMDPSGLDCRLHPTNISTTAVPLRTSAEIFLNRDYYSVFYPHVAHNKTVEMMLKDPMLNPWLVNRCD